MRTERRRERDEGGKKVEEALQYYPRVGQPFYPFHQVGGGGTLALSGSLASGGVYPRGPEGVAAALPKSIMGGHVCLQFWKIVHPQGSLFL